MTIAEVSKAYQLSADTLRYYERIGLIPPVRRSSGGIRDYSEEDCRWVDFVKCMRGAGLPIEVLIDYLALFQQGDVTIQARKEILMDQHDQLAAHIEEMQQTLDRLNGKIDRYEQTILIKEKKLRQAQDKPY